MLLPPLSCHLVRALLLRLPLQVLACGLCWGVCWLAVAAARGVAALDTAAAGGPASGGGSKECRPTAPLPAAPALRPSWLQVADKALAGGRTGFRSWVEGSAKSVLQSGALGRGSVWGELDGCYRRRRSRDPAGFWASAAAAGAAQRTCRRADAAECGHLWLPCSNTPKFYTPTVQLATSTLWPAGCAAFRRLPTAARGWAAGCAAPPPACHRPPRTGAACRVGQAS